MAVDVSGTADRMRLIEIQNDVSWMPKPNEVRLLADINLPPRALSTSVFVFAFEGQRLLMTKLTDRGWDLPGGHIEAGESPEYALKREVFEETACTLRDIRLFGYQHVTLLCDAPVDYPYPYPESYQLLYLAQVEAAGQFSATAEVAERRFFAPETAEALPWGQANRRLYELALQSIDAKA